MAVKVIIDKTHRVIRALTSDTNPPFDSKSEVVITIPLNIDLGGRHFWKLDTNNIPVAVLDAEAKALGYTYGID